MNAIEELNGRLTAFVQRDGVSPMAITAARYVNADVRGEFVVLAMYESSAQSALLGELLLNSDMATALAAVLLVKARELYRSEAGLPPERLDDGEPRCP